MPRNDTSGPNPTRWIGQPRRRVEDARLVTGQGRFVADLNPAGCLHVAFVRCPHAHAAIAAVGTEDALAMPGVAAVFTGADVAHLGDLPVNPLVDTLRVPGFPILAEGTVRAVGEPVAAVIAESPAEALDAAELVEPDLDPLDPVMAPGERAAGDPLFADLPGDEAFAHHWRAGDVEAAFARADTVVAVEIAHPRLAPSSIEPRAVLAEWDAAAAGITVWLSTQTPHRARTDIAAIAGLDPACVRVIAPDVGGAFGMKASIFPEDVLVAWAAARLERSVKWIGTRAEDLLAATHGRGTTTAGEMALAEDGTILALRARIESPLGHWLPFSAVVPGRNAGRILPGPYAVPAVDIEARGRVSTTAPVGIYRGAGRPEAAMLMERLMDEAARALALDPVALRRRNLIAADRLPYQTPTGETYDSGDYSAALEKACAVAGYDDLRAAQDARRRAGEIVGLGVAVYVEPCGQGWESAEVRIEPDGAVTAATGTSAQGQGRETAYAQIVADTLRVAPDAVTVVHGDTATAPAGIGALASRSTPIGGGALVRAAEDVRGQAIAVAAELLQATPGEVVLGNDGFKRCDRTGGCVSWRAVAERAADNTADGTGGAISAHAVFEAPGEAWGYGVCIACVAIDRDTGALTVERLVWLDDAGTVVNPMLVEGQLTGGIAQGLGEALMERIVYDDDGQLLTGSLMDYALPRAGDMPAIVLERTVTPSPLNPLGAKGVGEAGTIGAPPAVLNAALDALAPLGVRDLDMPMTAESIWRAMSNAPGKE